MANFKSLTVTVLSYDPLSNLRRIDLQRRLSNFENLFDIFDEL